MVEMLYDPTAQQTAFAIWEREEHRIAEHFEDQGRELVPYSPHNNLIKNNIILFPSQPQEYGSRDELIDDIRRYIHRYVDISEVFEHIASYYVLFSWLYDGFNEVPYLRLRGDYGSGKTRFLLTVGAVCYKPIFASGASTVSPLFHLLDRVQGTLILDEADFRLSDEKAEVVKILNNGNVRGLPVLRTEVTRDREFNPRAYSVFGPRVVASRGFYADRALESRFISEEMGQTRLRDDIPIALPDEYRAEALALRNKLLLYRFRNAGKRRLVSDLLDRSIEARLRQVFIPLLSIVDEPAVRNDLVGLASRYHDDIVAERGMDVEAQVLDILKMLFEVANRPYVPVKDITTEFVTQFGGEYERQITPRWIGGILRKKLRLSTRKVHGTYAVPLTECPKIDRLCEKYGVTSPAHEKIDDVAVVYGAGDKGDVGDISPAATIEF
jgi:hypothetical protein